MTKKNKQLMREKKALEEELSLQKSSMSASAMLESQNKSQLEALDKIKKELADMQNESKESQKK